MTGVLAKAGLSPTWPLAIVPMRQIVVECQKIFLLLSPCKYPQSLELTIQPMDSTTSLLLSSHQCDTANLLFLGHHGISQARILQVTIRS